MPLRGVEPLACALGVRCSIQVELQGRENMCPLL